MSKSSEAAKRRWADPEYAAKRKAQMREATKKRWEDPEYRKKMTEMSKARAAKTAEEQKERWKDPEYRKNQISKVKAKSKEYSEKAKRQWQDPEFRKKMAEVQKKNNANPNRKTRKGQKNSEEAKALQAKAAEKRWEDPEYRAKNEVRLRKQAKNPVNIKKRVEGTKKKFAEDPEFKARFHAGTSKCSTETNLANWQDPEYRKKMMHLLSEAFSKNWKDTNFRKYLNASIQKKIQEHSGDAAFIEKINKIFKDLRSNREIDSFNDCEDITPRAYMLVLNAIMVKKYWDKTPEQREEIIAARFGAGLNLPNKLEKSVIHLEIPELKYVGDGKMFARIGKKSKNPDFYVKGSKGKQWVELWGNYWHRGEDPFETTELFSNAGHSVLILWEKEVNRDINSVRERIERFIEDPTQNTPTKEEV